MGSNIHMHICELCYYIKNVPSHVYSSCMRQLWELSPRWKRCVGHCPFGSVLQSLLQSPASPPPSTPFRDSLLHSVPVGWSHVPENSCIFRWMQHSWHFPHRAAYPKLPQWAPLWLKDRASPFFRDTHAAKLWSCESDGFKVWVPVTAKQRGPSRLFDPLHLPSMLILVSASLTCAFLHCLATLWLHCSDPDQTETGCWINRTFVGFRSLRVT